MYQVRYAGWMVAPAPEGYQSTLQLIHDSSNSLDFVPTNFEDVLPGNHHRSHSAWQAPLCCRPLAAPPGNDGDKEPSLLSFSFDTSNTVGQTKKPTQLIYTIDR